MSVSIEVIWRAFAKRAKSYSPQNRGTAVAMALCLRVVMQQDEDAVVAFFPSDHHYLDNSAFREHVEFAFNQIEEYPHSLLILGSEASIRNWSTAG